MRLIAKKGYRDVLMRASAEILDNASIMATACRADGFLLDICSERLQQDPDVVAAALSCEISPECIFLVPKEVFEQHPKIAEQAIRMYVSKDWKKLFDFLPPAVFHTRSVLLAWFEKEWDITDFPFYQIVHGGNFGKDRDVLLAALKHNYRLSVVGAARSLCEDREFLEAAIEVDGRVIQRVINNATLCDYDMMLLAVGTSRKTLQVFYHGGFWLNCLVQFAQDVRERLKVADIFIGEFLRGIDVVTPHVAPAMRCRLPKLDCGYETGAGFKRLIAEYAGVPLGKELRHLRAASANLEFWGY